MKTLLRRLLERARSSSGLKQAVYAVIFLVVLLFSVACAMVRPESFGCNSVGLDQPIRFAWCNTQAELSSTPKDTSNEEEKTCSAEEEAL